MLVSKWIEDWFLSPCQPRRLYLGDVSNWTLMPCQLHGITSQWDENKKDTNISFQQSYYCSINSQAKEVFALFFLSLSAHYHIFMTSSNVNF